MALYHPVSKKVERGRVTLGQLIPLFVNYFNAIKDRDRFDGHQDIDISLDEFMKILNREGVGLPFNMLESLMWASQVQSDEGKFWHPHDAGFKKLCLDILQAQGIQYKIEWDRDYCLLNVQRKEYKHGGK